jgi:hypothetical protein
MRRKRRKDPDTGFSEIVVTILEDGNVLLPRNVDIDLAYQIALALGDKSAADAIRQAKSAEVLLGKRMCG